MTPTLVTLYSCSACFAVFLLVRFASRKRPAPYPPGPRGLPLVGNILDMPFSDTWRTFTQWGRTYGDIVYVNLLGQPVVILNSAKQAKSMLTKKSNIYCDRPTSRMGELIGWSEGLGMLRYGQPYREQNRYMHSFIGSKQLVARYHEVLVDEESKFLRRLLADSEKLEAEISRTAAAITLRIAYGYNVKEDADSLVGLVREAVGTLDTLSTPGVWLVEIFPFLRHFPATWFPGAGYKKAAAEMRLPVSAMLNLPYEFTKRELARNADLPPNFVAEHLRKHNPDPETELAIKWVAAFVYAGGSDTALCAMYSFVLAMTLYPNVQKRAQSELDAVVGNGRLPSFEDRDRLPFVEAIVKETFRWGPPARVNFPHRAMEDDIHDGYFIPKGTSVLANIWGILHDADTYPNPDLFDPSRFVTESGEPTGVPDPYDACFGYGRRRCPGVYLADASIFLWCSMILSVYDISKAVGPDGKIVEPTCEYISGVVSHPKPFKCSITPRSEKAERLIRSLD